MRSLPLIRVPAPLHALHLDLLLALRSASPYGLPLDTLLTDLRAARHRDLDDTALKAALRALADRSLVALLPSIIKPRWRITGVGLATLAEEGLASAS